MSTIEAYPEIGSRITVTLLEGYKLVQDRPFDCRGWSRDPRFEDGRYSGGCKCGTCNGTKREVEGTVDKTVYWMDNSIETFVDLDEGGRHIIRHKAPSGDVCF